MKERSLDQLLGVVAVVIPTGVGAYVVLRTLTAYWGHDSLASLIVAVIGAALALGVMELLTRVSRAGQLERELTRLPKSANESSLDLASPALGGMLRAQLEQTSMPALSDGLAPFLTGLLVMLGLLGTLLGLFQTVAGASHALTSSGDIDALRRSLSAPLTGLTRSFGCSAAGISASAMLGLALALVRKREARVLRRIQTYAATTLHALSPARRQLRALEQLAGQGNVLPAAAGVFETAGSTLGELAKQLTSLQEEALKAQQRAFSDVLASMRGEFSRAAGETGEALHARVSPLFEQLAARSGEALVAQAGALTQVARDVTSQLERDAHERREHASEAMRALDARLDQAERARAAAHGQELEQVTRLAERSLTEAERRERELGERWRELCARFDAQLEAAHSAERGRREALDTQLEAARASERERQDLLDAQLRAAREQASERLAQLEDSSARTGAELTRLSAALSAQLEQRLSLERAQDERAERVLLQLTAAAEALGQGMARHEQAFEQLLVRVPELIDTAATSSQEAAQVGMARLAELTEERLARVSSMLSEELAERASRTRTLDEHSASLTERARQSADQLEAAIARQGENLEGLTARVTALLPQLADAAQAGAAQTLARMTEHAEHVAERFTTLEAGLERGREQHAFSLAEQLTAHANELEQRLERTSAVVQEAAAVWHASSSELQTVAELFSTSVERQREAADAWLVSLGQVEIAVERAGKHAAHDMLADQLASTQEMFTRQLQFQRELFEQLRTLRGGQSRVSGEERDVSV